MGDCDVVIALPNEARILKNGPITCTDGAAERFVGNFTLDSGKDLEEIEIKTFVRPNVDLKVIYLRVNRVQ